MSNGVGGNISASTELVVEGQSELFLTEFYKVKYMYLMLFTLLLRFVNLINKSFFFHLKFRYSRSQGSSNDKHILWTSGEII